MALITSLNSLPDNNMAIKNRLRILVAEKEFAENRRLPYRTLSAEIGISKTVLVAYANNDVQRYDVDTLQKLLKYFGCSISEFLEYVPDGEG